MPAPKRIRVNVTDECIKEGVARDEFSCPIALAIRQQYDSTIDDVAVLMNTIMILFKDELRYTDYASPKAVKFVDAFDLGNEVKPISITLHKQG